VVPPPDHSPLPWIRPSGVPQTQKASVKSPLPVVGPFRSAGLFDRHLHCGRVLVLGAIRGVLGEGNLPVEMVKRHFTLPFHLTTRFARGRNFPMGQSTPLVGPNLPLLRVVFGSFTPPATLSWKASMTFFLNRNKFFQQGSYLFSPRDSPAVLQSKIAGAFCGILWICLPVPPMSGHILFTRL